MKPLHKHQEAIWVNQPVSVLVESINGTNFIDCSELLKDEGKVYSNDW